MSYSKDDYPQIFDKSSYEFPVTMLRLMAGRLVTKFDIPPPCKHSLMHTTPHGDNSQIQYYSFFVAKATQVFTAISNSVSELVTHFVSHGWL